MARRRWRAIFVHALRCGLLLLAVVPLVARRDARSEGDEQEVRFSIAQVREIEPAAEAIGEAVGGDGWFLVLDAQGQSLGMAASTWPVGNGAIGYRGPSELLVVANDQGVVKGIRLIASRDTEEHVAAIVNDAQFWASARGLRLGETVGAVDAVSGATLTSYAMWEALSMRLAGQRVSLKFPHSLTIDEASSWFDTQDRALFELSDDASLEVRNDQGQVIGRVVRTGPLVDNVLGYQGPSELLVGLDGDERVIGVVVRESYDNEPYVGYVREERGYWRKVKGMRIPELANWDPVEAGVEGVSGATMTSMAAMRTLVEWAEREQRRQVEEDEAVARGPGLAVFEGVRLNAKEVVSIFVVIGGVIIHLTRLRGWRKLAWLWRGVLIVVFGLWTGNLLSQALLLGWMEAGIAWKLAPGLTMVAAVALLLPPLTKHNVYCHQVCPHGALQRIIKPARKRELRLGGRVTRWLSRVPWLLLACAYLASVWGADVELAALEPFNAYLFPVAALGSVVLALVSIAFSAWVPMGYCRMGCPTGRLLDYLRRDARSDVWTWRDTGVATVVGIGLVAMW